MKIAIASTPLDSDEYLPADPTAATRLRFDALCARFRTDVFRFALWLARDREIAEDVVQETFMRAWGAIDSLVNPAAARSWLLAIARREHARLYERKRYPTVDIDELVAADDPALALQSSEDNLAVRAAVSALKIEYREPLVLQVLMGYSIEEIASHLGLGKAAVLSRLYRARQKLLYSLTIAAQEADAPIVGQKAAYCGGQSV